ncbi:hypothetical protein N658DRAFT_220351 [Parathielavia hyrcaniae]|uniref:Uncharacterized protein n=1 Tax=Parathielavia hyrcaniae TaxID=113614 RepID=A0AAN6PV37_9PEZI|nr:hypothetical protein N658DRAFT_220351 [Parathielavia hyrcaniae]
MRTQEHRARGRGRTPSHVGFPGDMSHHPLATLTREHHQADWVPHQRRDRRLPNDVISGPFPGVTYHHGGPFDAVAMEFNANTMSAPIDAVRDSNMEALRATLAEYVKDSLTKHLPLQGTFRCHPAGDANFWRADHALRGGHGPVALPVALYSSPPRRLPRRPQSWTSHSEEEPAAPPPKIVDSESRSEAMVLRLSSSASLASAVMSPMSSSSANDGLGADWAGRML